MPQSLANVLVHLVFSTKDRCACLAPPIRPALHAYLATVARNTGCDALRVGGVVDHVHLAVRLSRTVAIASLVEQLKTSSSKWLKTHVQPHTDSRSPASFPTLENFAWQRGYGAFSLGPDDLDALLIYIDAQEEHHRTTTFQDEYRAFLTKHDVAFDERYAWDGVLSGDEPTARVTTTLTALTDESTGSVDSDFFDRSGSARCRS